VRFCFCLPKGLGAGLLNLGLRLRHRLGVPSGDLRFHRLQARLRLGTGGVELCPHLRLLLANGDEFLKTFLWLSRPVGLGELSLLHHLA
jgi:hypothetical protein